MLITDHTFCFRQILEKKWQYNVAVPQLFTRIAFKQTYNSIKREVLYTILMESGIPMEEVWLIKMCLNEGNNTARVDKYLSVMLPTRIGLKQGHALLPIILNFAL